MQLDHQDASLFGYVANMRLAQWTGIVHPNQFSKDFAYRDQLKKKFSLLPKSLKNEIQRLRRKILRLKSLHCISTVHGDFLPLSLSNSWIDHCSSMGEEVNLTQVLLQQDYEKIIAELKGELEKYLSASWKEKLSFSENPPRSVVASFINEALCFFPDEDGIRSILSLELQFFPIVGEGTLLSCFRENKEDLVFSVRRTSYIKELFEAYIADVRDFCDGFLKNKCWFHGNRLRRLYEEAISLNQKNIFSAKEISFTFDALLSHVFSYPSRGDKKAVLESVAELKLCCDESQA